LPVLVWIYGGGLFEGSSADPQYNLSGIVQTSQAIGRPIIAASLNYRLGVWGFLQTPEILAEGSSNAGLLDQRLALRWVHENIAAFGGDPTRVTIWGESAGAQSIGFHLSSYGGRNDDLFRAAITESGGPEGCALTDLSFYASPFENLTRAVNCWTATDQLSCLRDLSSEELYATEMTVTWNPIVDGDFFQDYPSTSLAEGKFIHVPLLIGANTDEGVSFSVTDLDNTTAVFQSLMTWRTYALSPTSIRKLLASYPNDPANEPPYHITANETFPQYGLQWRRSAAIGGDMVIIAQRRKVCEVFSSAGQDVYSYRFDTPAWNAPPTDGIPHFVNVAFSFQNISGNLGPLPQFQRYKNLSFDIGRAYVNFVYDHNPSGDSQGGLPCWPSYSLQKPMNMVLNSNGSFVEDDTWRKAGVAFINSIWRELLA
jgi:carboxylesterase type B